MAKPIQEAVDIIFSVLGDDRLEYSVSQLESITGLTTSEIKDAISILKDAGYVELTGWFGLDALNPDGVKSTPRGRYEYERRTMNQETSTGDESNISLPPVPVGSPYGFNDQDWEIVAKAKARQDQLSVVFGFQFESSHYDTEDLKQNVREMFHNAVEKYKNLPDAISVELAFRPLAAGYGEHLFNEIARDIISADIGVFDTSDFNPNVMLEIGVALTWGIRVLPIKDERCSKPPSDISGQTWADYRDSGGEFVDPDHENKLLKMVERAVRKKG